MALVHMFAPHETYQRCATQSSGDNSGLVSASLVLYVAIGPNPLAHILITVSTLSGQLYARPLPDFLAVERSQGILTLAQLVNAPLNQLTKTTAKAANWTSDTVNVVAQSVKQMVDEAYGDE